MALGFRAARGRPGGVTRFSRPTMARGRYGPGRPAPPLRLPPPRSPSRPDASARFSFPVAPPPLTGHFLQ